VRFEDHWRGRPPLDSVELRVIPEEDVAALELQAGNVDIIFNSVSVEALPQLRANPDITIHQAAGNTFVFATTNFEKDRRGGYKDAAKVREGLSLFWNAEERIPPIVGDFGEVANQVIPPWQPGYDPNMTQYPYDPEPGKQLLEEGGIPPGGTLNFLALSTVPYQCDIATSFASDMTQQGYKVNLECLPGQTALPIMQQYEWDLLFPRTSGRATAAAMYAERYALSLAVPAPEDQWTLADEDFVAIIDRMRAATTEEEYVALGQEAARYLHDIYYQLPAYWENFLVATGPRVQATGGRDSSSTGRGAAG
jgi:ABC-type transport system substrate-binding protein